MTDKTYSEQEETLRKIHHGAADKKFDELKKISPEFVKFAMEIVGNIYSRAQLDMRTREIVAITIFTMLGFTTVGLELHIINALNVGVTKEEILEVIMQIGVFAGLATASNALLTVKKVFESRGI